MTGFWLIVLAMLLLAAGLILAPLLRRHGNAEVSRDGLDAELFRERLAELEAERQQGRIDADELRELREDLERTLLAEVSAEPTRTARRGPMAALGMAITALVLASVLGYYYVAVYRGPVQEWIALQEQMDAVVDRALLENAELPSQQELAGFVRVLQARLQREGMNDPDGLYLLGIGYLRLQLPEPALTALARAFELDPHRPDVMLAAAHAMILSDDGRLNEASFQLLQGVLHADPHNLQALMLLGFGHFNNGAFEEALEVWRPLAAMQDPDSEGGRLIRRLIARAEQSLTEPEAASALQIAVTVDLAPALQSRLSPEDTLFIFAKAASGPPMPLAAVRQPARGFPVQVVLDDSRAMLPSLKLSNFDRVVVSARISRSGGATAQSGDLEGVSPILSLEQGPQAVSLLIDQVVQ